MHVFSYYTRNDIRHCFGVTSDNGFASQAVPLVVMVTDCVDRCTRWSKRGGRHVQVRQSAPVHSVTNLSTRRCPISSRYASSPRALTPTTTSWWKLKVNR